MHLVLRFTFILAPQCAVVEGNVGDPLGIQTSLHITLNITNLTRRTVTTICDET